LINADTRFFNQWRGKEGVFTNSVEKGVSQPSRVLDEDKRDLRFGNYRTIDTSDGFISSFVQVHVYEKIVAFLLLEFRKIFFYKYFTNLLK